MLRAVAALFCVVLADVPAQAGPIVTGLNDIGVRSPAHNVAEVRRAVEAFKAGQPDQAFALLKQARQAHPELPPARLLLAELHISSNQPQLARVELERAAAEEPDYPATYVVFGDLALAEQRVTDARLHFDKAINLLATAKLPDEQKRRLTLLSQQGLAAVAEARADWAGAQRALAAWLESEPQNAATRVRLARALFELERVDEARQQLVRAAGDDAQLDPPGTTLGWYYTNRGDMHRAEAEMRSAVLAQPQNVQGQLGLALWLLQQEKFTDAKTAAEAAAKLDPESLQVATVQGLIARHLRDYDAAERHFQSVLVRNPGDFLSSNQLALVLAELDDASRRQRALQLAEMNARQYPQMAEALSTLGWVYHRLDRNDDAVRLLQAAVETGQGAADTRYYLARVLAERGEVDQARRLVQTALESSPGKFGCRREAREWLEKIGDKATGP